MAQLSLVACLLLASANAEAREVTLLFNYTGLINQRAVDGHAVLKIDETTGEYSAVQWFDKLADSVSPIVMSASVISISCSNGARMDEMINIIRLSRGDYTSIREVEIHDARGNSLGKLVANGRFHKVSDDTFRADVSWSGTYRGPVNLKLTEGYDLVTKPDGEDVLRGETSIDVYTTDGEVVPTYHTHTYKFEDGTTERLRPNRMVLRYHEYSWDPKERFFEMKGVSSMEPY